MAKTNRPAEITSVWSTDANFPAGAEPWNGTPTKVAPSAGEIAGGSKPDRRFPAAWYNWELNRNDRMLQYLDMIEVRNMGPRLTVGTGVLPTAAMANGYCTAYDAYHGMLYALYNLEMLKSNSDGAGTWSDTTALIPGTISSGRGLAFNPTTGTGYMLGSNQAARSNPGSASSTWTAVAVANISDARGIIWDPYRGRFVAFGAVTGTHPGIWTLTDVAATQRTLTGAAGFSFPIYQLAAGPNGLVAIHGTNTDFRVWTSPDGDTWTVNNPGIAAGSYWLDYDDGRDEFVLLSGGGVSTSPDGITWSYVGGVAVGSKLLNSPTGICCFGGIWVVPGKTSIVGEPLTTGLFYSRDRGTTWELGRHSLGDIVSITRQDGRIWLANAGTLTGAQTAFGLRLR